MSAYVVEDETINRIVGHFFQVVASKRTPMHLLAPLVPAGHVLGFAGLDEACTKLGTAMHMLNVGAVRARYDDADEADMIGPAYQYAHAPATPMQAYKSLGCWLYQCSEGNVPESLLHKALEEVYNRLAHEIVDGLPAYEAATWG